MNYLTRRNGRYYLQLRLSSSLATLFGVTVLRRTLETNDLATAKRRMAANLKWLRPMNDSKDPPLSTHRGRGLRGEYSGSVQACP
jgi:hypothetical protein